MFPTEDLVKELEEVNEDLRLMLSNPVVNTDNLFNLVRKQNEALLKYFQTRVLNK